jgi:undecaprenyl pyrophosphate phosphatase UppP
METGLIVATVAARYVTMTAVGWLVSASQAHDLRVYTFWCMQFQECNYMHIFANGVCFIR